jgi:integrase
MQLTDISIRNLKSPESGQVTYTDDGLPGFGVRVSKSGKKTFVLVYGRARRRATLGRVGIIKLKDAREKAKSILAERTLGKGDSPAISFERALALFYEVRLSEKKASTQRTTKHRLDRHFLPSLRHERLSDIHTRDIADILDRLKRKPSEAFHAYADIRLFFRWAVGRKYLAISSVAGLDAPKASEPRSRVLSDAEVRKVVSYAMQANSHFAKIVLLLLLTGQRRGEIAAIHSSFIDNEMRLITWPAELTKNRRQHTFPFGTMAAPLLDGEGLLFPAQGPGDRPFNGWSKAKAIFDKACGVADWTLHDLRRTFATNLASLGVPIHVTEKLLNHVSGTMGGIVAMYQRHAYMEEMRAAIEAWEAKLARLVEAEPA